MASRKAQIQAICGIRSGALIDRAESYLAAVNLWSTRGNAKVVNSVGPGLVAVCCWMAAQSLNDDLVSRSHAERASGLTPQQFRNAERDLKPAIQSISVVSTSQPLSNSLPSLITSPSVGVHLGLNSPSSSKNTAEALLAKAEAVQAGTMFSRSTSRELTSSPFSTPRSVRFQTHFANGVAPFTPSKSSLLKRSITRTPDSASKPNPNPTSPFNQNGLVEWRDQHPTPRAQCLMAPNDCESSCTRVQKRMRTIISGLPSQAESGKEEEEEEEKVRALLETLQAIWTTEGSNAKPPDEPKLYQPVASDFHVIMG